MRENKNKDTPIHVFLRGDSGVGKSRLLEKYTERNKGYEEKDDQGTEIDIKPVLYAELPNPFTIAEFYQTIIKALGAPQFAGAKVGELKRQAFTLIEKQRVELLILDEMDYILTSRYVTKKEAMEAIKHVSNIGKISVVLAGTPESEQLTKINFQYFRRFPVTKLYRFAEFDQHFCDLLQTIEDQLELPKTLGLGDPMTEIPQLLHEMSQGILGALTPILQRTFRKLIANYDYEEVSNPILFLSMLELAQREIIGDNESEFIKMLKTSDAC